tara:strand:- start:533 stop:1414 length:882 start_codon:yes stop_codon:yes gene_type:complete
MQEIISVEAAIEAGLKFYFTGKECARGHLSKRLVSNRCCYECSKLRVAGKLKDEMRQKKDLEQVRVLNTTGYISRSDAIENGLTRYFTGKPCPYGHISERMVSSYACCECNTKKYYDNHEKEKERSRKKAAVYSAENKEKILEKAKDRYYSDVEGHRRKSREYSRNNKDKISAYRKKNKDKIRKSSKEYKSRPDVVTSEFIRRCLARVQDNFGGRRAKYEKVIGYTMEQLSEHIEKQFKEGMSWDNRTEWHIDHIRPIKSFLDDGIKDPAVINALSNLQPLWAQDNLAKGAKY